MWSGKRSAIWGFAFGYFACYIPYSALTKSLSGGSLTGGRTEVSGFELLPATAIATAFIFLAYFGLTAAWRDFRKTAVLGIAVPLPRWQTMISGTATAVIIMTTTLNYTFAGISVLFALLLMRGGVLILAPFVDRLSGRTVHWYSWTAFSLSLLAVALALANVAGYDLTLVAVLNLSAYLSGYIVRLNAMSRIAKKPSTTENRSYFLEETFVAAVMLIAIPGSAAIIGRGEIVQQLRSGFTTFLLGSQVWPALAIGVCYASLYYFGSRIYLDKRENTFCIPLNRCSSLLSGVAATFLLAALAGQPLPSLPQFAGTAIIIVALLILSVATLPSRWRASLGADVGERILLFVCSGNRSRSPMARMICQGEIARRLRQLSDESSLHSFRAISAGLSADPGQPMSDSARQALENSGELVMPHTTQNVTAEMVRQAELIYCMTTDQCRKLVKQFPQAAAKTIRLDPQQDIDDPAGKDLSAFLTCANQLKTQVFRRLEELGLAAA